MARAVSVSYTHLDVYKRQVVDVLILPDQDPGYPSNTPLFACFLTEPSVSGIDHLRFWFLGLSYARVKRDRETISVSCMTA